MKPPRSAIGIVLALLLVAPAAAAQETPPPGPEADMSLTMQGPATTPLVGSSFQLVMTIENRGPATATDAVYSQYIPPELELVSVTSSDPADDCTPGDPGEPTTTAPPASATPESGSGSGDASSSAPGYYRDAVNCTLGSMGAGQTSVITLDLRRIGARETYSSAWVGSQLNDSNYENNYIDIIMDADRTNPADVGVTLDSPTSPAVGADFTYTLKVTNNGPSTATAVTLTNPTGYGLSFVSVAPSRAVDRCALNDYSEPGTAAPEYGGYSEVVCRLGAIEPGQSVPVEVTVNRASAYEIWNSASVQTTNYDENYENDYAYAVIAADPSVTSDLTVKMSGPEGAPLVGSQFDLVIDVTNNGPAASGDTWLSNYLPPGLEFVSASPADTCSFNDHGPYPMADGPAAGAPSQEAGDAYYPVAPGGVFCSIGSVASGGTARVTITVKRTAAREIWNSAWVSSSNHDPNYDNNYSDLLVPPDRSNPADIAVTMTAPRKPDVGADFAFTAQVTNNGPSAADNVTFTDYVPYEVEFKSVASSDASDTCTFNDGNYGEPAPLRPAYYGAREVTCSMGTLAAGETTTVTIEATRISEYEIWNSGWASTSNFDENFENDYASVLVEGEPYPGACPADGGGVRGSNGADEIVIGECYAETSGGADQVSVVPPSAGNSTVLSGRGPDTVNVNLTIGSSTRRLIDVNTGRGNDTVRIVVAPGAGNATIKIVGGFGGDTIEVDAPAGVKRLRIVLIGGPGNDRIVWTTESSTPGEGFPSLIMRGGDGIDLLQGGFGDDFLSGGAGGDRLFGNLGDDELRGGLGYDVCRGGPGTNVTLGC